MVFSDESGIDRVLNYDNAGNLILDSGEKGNQKEYYYDLLGNTTRENTVGDQSTANDDREVVYKYNNTGGVIQKINTEFSIDRTGDVYRPTDHAIYDRWGNVIERGFSSSETASYDVEKLTYNHLNQVASHALLEVDVLDEAGASYLQRPTNNYAYDKVGNLILETNANGWSKNYAYDLAGNLIYENNLGDVKQYNYNDKGEKVFELRGASIVSYEYDDNGRLLEVIRHLGHSTGLQQFVQKTFLKYEYDSAGRQVIVSRLKPSTIVQEDDYFELMRTNFYEYDSLGNTVEENSLVYGDYQLTAYDSAGRKISEANRAGDTKAWHYDANTGLLNSYVDLGGNEHRYFYTDHGELERDEIWKDGAFLNDVRAYQYYTNGLLKSISDTGEGGLDGVAGSIAASNNWTYLSNYRNESAFFEYDAAGRRVYESHVNNFDLDRLGILFSTVTETLVHSERIIETAYDSLGRILNVTSAESNQDYGVGGSSYSQTTSGLNSLTYSYDAMGNRRRIQASIENRNGGGSSSQDLWYTYDLANRVLINEGELINNAIGVTSNQGERYTYDSIGRRRSSTSIDGQSQKVETYGYDWRALGNPEGLFEQDYGFNTITSIQTSVDSSLIDSTVRTVDFRGYVTSETYTKSFGLVGENEIYMHEKLYDYDASGRLLVEDTDYYAADGIGGAFWARTDTYDYRNGFDLLGNIESYSLDVSGLYGTNDYTYNVGYKKFDAYMPTTTSVTKNNVLESTTNQLYDLRADQRYVITTGEDGFHRNFVTSREGKILFRLDGSQGQDYYYQTGNVLGDSGQLSGNNFGTISSQRAFQNSSLNPSSYSVRVGDTLSSIAQQIYGDADFWYVIADANGLFATDELIVGRVLVIPNIVSSIHNNETVYKPYNPGEIVGSLLPETDVPDPPPPKKPDGGCPVFAIVIVVIVIIIATIVTAGAAAVAFGAVAAGTSVFAAGTAVLTGSVAFTFGAAAAAFVGGFVGSVAGQLVGKGLGVNDGFSLREAIRGGFTATASAGVASLLKGSNFFGSTVVDDAGNATRVFNEYGKVAYTVANHLNNYAAGKLTGVEAHFNWSDVAATTVSNYLGNKAVDYIGGKGLLGPAKEGGTQYEFDPNTGSLSFYDQDFQAGSFLGKIGSSLISGYADATAQRLFNAGGVQQWRGIAANAFGHSIGSSLIDTLKAQEQSVLTKRKRLTATVSALGSKDIGLTNVNTGLVNINPSKLEEYFGTDIQGALDRVEMLGEDISSGATYIVKKGDTLSEIAEKTRGSAYSIGAFLDENGSIVDPDKIYTGQVLTVPAEGSINADELSRGRSITSALGERAAARDAYYTNLFSLSGSGGSGGTSAPDLSIVGLGLPGGGFSDLSVGDLAAPLSPGLLSDGSFDPRFVLGNRDLTEAQGRGIYGDGFRNAYESVDVYDKYVIQSLTSARDFHDAAFSDAIRTSDSAGEAVKLRLADVGVSFVLDTVSIVADVGGLAFSPTVREGFGSAINTAREGYNAFRDTTGGYLDYRASGSAGFALKEAYKGEFKIFRGSDISGGQLKASQKTDSTDVVTRYTTGRGLETVIQKDVILVDPDKKRIGLSVKYGTRLATDFAGNTSFRNSFDVSIKFNFGLIKAGVGFDFRGPEIPTKHLE